MYHIFCVHSPAMDSQTVSMLWLPWIMQCSDAITQWVFSHLPDLPTSSAHYSHSPTISRVWLFDKVISYHSSAQTFRGFPCSFRRKTSILRAACKALPELLPPILSWTPCSPCSLCPASLASHSSRLGGLCTGYHPCLEHSRPRSPGDSPFSLLQGLHPSPPTTPRCVLHTESGWPAMCHTLALPPKALCLTTGKWGVFHISSFICSNSTAK